jgi:hypothetical protein
MGVNITVFSNTEFLPALTISALVFSDCKVWSNRDDLVYRFVSEDQTETYYPNLENKELYDVSFNNFKKLYPRLKGI